MKALLQIRTSQWWLLVQKMLGKRPSDKGQTSSELNLMRKQIDALDDQILQLLASRMTVAEQIGEYKKQQSILAHQPQRWAEVRAQRLEKARVLGLGENFMENFLELIHQESLQRQA
ncbi:MAG: chorismate mutase [Microscillaceae bacterium]|jgi:chorismate mutase|nr:chorismate mutase [Microscillaceae bacterium]